MYTLECNQKDAEAQREDDEAQLQARGIRRAILLGVQVVGGDLFGLVPG